MPIELRRTHHTNDSAVMLAYGFDQKQSDDDSVCITVAELLRTYQEMAKERIRTQHNDCQPKG